MVTALCSMTAFWHPHYPVTNFSTRKCVNVLLLQVADTLSCYFEELKLISILVAIHLGDYFVFHNHELQKGEQLFLSTAPFCSYWQGFCLWCLFGTRVPVLPWKPGAVQAAVRSQACLQGAGKLCKGSSVPGCECAPLWQPHQSFSFLIFAK